MKRKIAAPNGKERIGQNGSCCHIFQERAVCVCTVVRFRAHFSLQDVMSPALPS